MGLGDFLMGDFWGILSRLTKSKWFPSREPGFRLHRLEGVFTPDPETSTGLRDLRASGL